LLPGRRAAGALHPLVDQEEIGPCDRLVVTVGLAERGGEALQPLAEQRQRFEERAAGEVEPRQADMVDVVEEILRQRAVLEPPDELAIVHDSLFHDGCAPHLSSNGHQPAPPPSAPWAPRGPPRWTRTTNTAAM